MRNRPRKVRRRVAAVVVEISMVGRSQCLSGNASSRPFGSVACGTGVRGFAEIACNLAQFDRACSAGSTLFVVGWRLSVASQQRNQLLGQRQESAQWRSHTLVGRKGSGTGFHSAPFPFQRKPPLVIPALVRFQIWSARSRDESAVRASCSARCSISSLQDDAFIGHTKKRDV